MLCAGNAVVKGIWYATHHVSLYRLFSLTLFQPTECFNAPGENYELIPEEDEIDYDLSAKSSHHKKDKKHKKHKKRKRESSRSAR
jgi:hypothetical protein